MSATHGGHVHVVYEEDTHDHMVQQVQNGICAPSIHSSRLTEGGVVDPDETGGSHRTVLLRSIVGRHARLRLFRRTPPGVVATSRTLCRWRLLKGSAWKGIEGCVTQCLNIHDAHAVTFPNSIGHAHPELHDTNNSEI